MREKLLIVICLSIFFLLIGGCKSKKIEDAIRDASIDGIWSAKAYGIVAELKDKTITFYQTTTDYCHRWHYEISYSDFVKSSKMDNELNALTATFADIKQPGMKMARINNLPANCTNNILAQVGDANYQFDPQLELKVFWQTFNEYYAFFNIESVNWNDIYNQADSLINESTTEHELFAVLSTMVAPLKDFHSSITSESIDEDFSVNRKPDIEDIAFEEFIAINNISEELTEQQILDFEVYFQEQLQITYETILSFFNDPNQIYSNESDTVAWGQLQGEIGYILITTMDVAELGDEGNSIAENIRIFEQTLTSIFNSFIEMNGVIIDVRTNDGGDDFVGRRIVSRLIENNLHVYSKQARMGTGRTELQRIVVAPSSKKRFLGPVVALTSSTTSSAAETFALALRARHNTKIIGEATAGGFSDILPKTLPNGIEYGLSNEFYVSTSGEEFEGVGVPVNQQQTFFTLEQRQAGQDNALSAAMIWINSMN